MKKFLFLLFFIILLPLPVFAVEKIDSVNIKINFNKDSSFNVEEMIEYDFGTEEKHGIYRDIPIQGKEGKELKMVGIKVTDENKQNYNFTTFRNGENLQIKVGDANKLITGKHVYIISYSVKNALNFFSDHDELYWNAVGTGWGAKIAIVSTEVVVPKGLDLDKIKYICFQGVTYGTNLNCDQAEASLAGDKIIFTSQNLPAYNGQTIVIGFPKGYFVEPTFWEKHSLEFLFFLLPVISFIVMFYLWRTRGCDPEGKGTIITQFDAPDNLTPIEAGTILDHKLQPRDFSAEIIDLAIKGYLKITRVEGGFLKKEDYILKRLKPGDDLPNEFDRKLLHAFMVHSNKDDEVKLSALKDKFYTDYVLIKKSVYSTLIKKGYYQTSPENVKIIYSIIAFVIFVIGIVLIQYSSFVFAAFLLSALCVFGFGLAMPARTIKGVQARDHILGLKTYLTVAEKDRLEFHNAPEKNPATFEKFLPFAIALCVEKAWAEQFADIYKTNPDWYNGDWSKFNSLILVSSLSNFSSTATSVISKASSGGSGFSGGGVGGGFGGGGGGSW